MAFTESLKKKVIETGVKFKLITGEEGAKQQRELLERSIKTSRTRFDALQSPEEKQKTAEGLAGKYGSLAEMTEGDEQKIFAQKRQEYLKKAVRNASKAEENDLKRIQIEQNLAKKTITELEGMKGKLQSPAKQLENDKQLMEAYKKLGKVEPAVQLQENILKLQRETAGQSNDLLKIIIEKLSLGLDLQKQQIKDHGEKLLQLQEVSLQSDPGMEVMPMAA